MVGRGLGGNLSSLTALLLCFSVCEEIELCSLGYLVIRNELFIIEVNHMFLATRKGRLYIGYAHFISIGRSQGPG